jgi:hypothetical protein
MYGAFIGGLVGGGIAAWRSHLDPWPLLDIAAPSMLVGQAIGRLGCLCNGNAWGGDATGCPFCLAIRYTNQNDLLPANLRGVPTYAYPLYEIAAEALLLATLWLFRDRLRQTFPDSSRVFGCPASIGRRLHCAGVRIVSLLPLATEIVCLLGLEDQLVGVSADSDWPVEAVNRQLVLNTVSIDTSQLTSQEIDTAAGDGHRGASLYHVDSELLRQLRPDLILTQEICEVCAVSRRDVELAKQTLGYTPRVLSLSPVTLDQVLEDVDLVLARMLHPERFSEPIPSHQALKVSSDGQRLEPYQ